MGEEKYRLVVEGPPNWTSFRDFWKMFYDEGAVVVSSTYAKVGGLYDFGFRHDPDHPLESLADYCLGCYTNLNLPSRIDMICKYIDEYQADGLLINSIKSCNSFSRRAAADPARGREAHRQARRRSSRRDLVDPRYFSAANVKNRLESYFQMVKQKRGACRGALKGAATMRCFIGIDLGSTTTKAVVIDEHRNILGRGITNSRSNYDTAAAIAKQEALVNSRFYLFRQALGSTGRAERRARDAFLRPARARLPRRAVPRAAGDLRATCERSLATAKFGDSDRRGRRGARRGVPPADGRGAGAVRAGRPAQVRLLPRHRRQPVPRHRRGRAPRKSARGTTSCSTCSTARSSRSRTASTTTRSGATCWRRSSARSGAARDGRAARRRSKRRSRASSTRRWRRPTSIGTGYGRARLPFSKEHVRSEILCHGLGAHVMYPEHRDRARHRRPGHEGDPGRPAAASSRASR